MDWKAKTGCEKRARGVTPKVAPILSPKSPRSRPLNARQGLWASLSLTRSLAPLPHRTPSRRHQQEAPRKKQVAPMFDTLLLAGFAPSPTNSLVDNVVTMAIVAVGYATFALLFTQVADSYTRWLYKRGLLKRQAALPQSTHRMGTWVSAFIVVFPSAMYIALHQTFSAAAPKFELDLPLWPTLVYSLFLAYVKDAMFYHTHRFMHLWRPLYNFSHHTHHNEWPVNVWTIGHVDLPEYVLAAAPSHFLLTLFACHTSSQFHFFSWTIANWNVSVIEILGHCGYESSILLPLLWPPLVFGLFLPFTLAAADHEDHHHHVNGNYSLIFSHWDRIYGTWIPDMKKLKLDAHLVQRDLSKYVD